MQFEHTEYLLLLLVIPILYILYARYSVRRKHTVLKFGSFDIISKASQKKSNVRRHLPFILIISAIGMSILALADLQISVTQLDAAEPKGKNISIVLDGSESMAAPDYTPNRLEAAKQSIARLIQELNSQDYVGIVMFETGATTVSYMTYDKQSAHDAVMAIKQGKGATAIGDGLALGIDMVLSIPDRDKIIILLSDGVHNSGRTTPDEAIQYAKTAEVKVHTIGIGSAEPVFLKDDVFGDPQYVHLDEGVLRHIANATGGTYSKSLDNKALDLIFADITVDLVYDTKHQSTSYWFTLAALSLLVATAYVMYGKYRIVA